MSRIGIIDDWVNPKYLSEKLRIQYIFVEGADKESKNQDESLLTHATVIVKILEQRTKDYEILNFVLASNMDEPVNIQKLKKALELCQEEEIDILCMSLGTVQISERNYMYPQIRKLYERGVILIAAADNHGHYLLPAAFREVIGVDVDLEEPQHPGKYYLCEDNLWNIDLQADCRFPIQLKGKSIYPSTSYAVPVIVAWVNHFLNQGFRGQDAIRIQLKKYAAGYRTMRRDVEKNQVESSLPVVGSCELEEKEWGTLMDLMQSQFGLEVIGLDVGGKMEDERFLKLSGWKEEEWEHMICWAEHYTVAELVCVSLPEEKETCDILIRKTQKGDYQCTVPETKEEVCMEEPAKVCKWIIDTLS